ncbi:MULTISPECIES: cell division protein FtsZ [Bacillaceae]|uniref:Cell division protein FtsZ n=1 Tax=Evansella alkalicola TaxID=745819 RepID=A0ABS6JXU4_9BACI|nr:MULTISPECIES: cell division protein FtsZ [Bacillaceae]MBU9722037.1 cell division protein FtsZ [Bacillus alkalicola]
MDEPIIIYDLKQELHNQDIHYLLKRENVNICFFRFVGGNPSETDEVFKQLYRLKDSRTIVFGIFRFPFRFEGKQRMEIAIDQYFKLKKVCDSIIYFYSDGMMETLEEGTSIRDANILFEEFEKAPIRAIEEMVKNTGDINIDIRDIQSFIRNKDGALFVRTFEGNSFDEPLKHLISTPYLSQNFAEGNQLMVNIGYTNDVDMDAFRQINLRINDLFHKMEIFKIGSYLMDKPGRRLKITVMANGIVDPFEQKEDTKNLPLYRYWFANKWRKVTQKEKQNDWFSVMNKTAETIKKDRLQ